jgi:predicted metal-dependent peptidase
MKTIQTATAILITEEPFYGFLLSKFKKIKSDRVPTACVYITDTINLEYNEEYFDKVGIQDTVKILKHECEHILRDHIARAKDIGIHPSQQQLMKRLNLAADATINTKDLKDASERNGWVTTAKLNKMMKETDPNHVDMPEGETAEYYFSRINKFAEDNKDKLGSDPMEGSGDTTDDHSLWGESTDSEEVMKQITKQAVNDAVKSAGGIGSVPNHIVTLVNSLNKSEVNWKKELRQFFVNTLKAEWTATRKKRNRRYGILYAGKKSKPKLKVFVLGDESGSMNDVAVGQVYAEIDAMARNDIEVMYVAMDAEASEPIPYKVGMKIDRTKAGGTVYGSGITMAKKHKADIIIVAGDMDAADTPIDPKIPVIWCVIGTKQKPPGNFGKAIYVEVQEK